TRQPPGGSYHLVYTDEHGATTSGVIPVPTGHFALRSPSQGATMLVPPSGSHQVVVIHLAVPVPAPDRSITALPPGESVDLEELNVVACPTPDMLGKVSCHRFQESDADLPWEKQEAVRAAVAAAVFTGIITHRGECAIPLVGFKAQPGPGSIGVSILELAQFQESQFDHGLA